MHKVRDVIADREVLSVRADQTVKEVVDYLHEHERGAVAVKEGKEVVGVFSERDLLRRVVHKGLDVNSVPVREVMTPGCHKVALEADYRLAKMRMYDLHVRHLAVVDENDEFLSLVSTRDLIETDVQELSDLVDTLNDRYYQGALKDDDDGKKHKP